MHALVRAPRMLAAIETILGPEITFHGDFQLTPKLPGDAPTAFPWHQDTQYYGVPSQHMHVVTAWVPLVDADTENGCLWVVPGSHRWGLQDAVRGADMNFRPTACEVEQRGQPVAMPMQRGDVLLLGNFTFHSSQLNQSGQVRWSLDLGYSASRGARPTSREEAASYAYLYDALPRVGRTPLIVRSAQAGNEQRWEQWLERPTAELRQIAARAPTLATHQRSRVAGLARHV